MTFDEWLKEHPCRYENIENVRSAWNAAISEYAIRCEYEADVLIKHLEAEGIDWSPHMHGIVKGLLKSATIEEKLRSKNF